MTRHFHKTLLATTISFAAISAHAFTETFETQTNNAHTFTSDGVVFAIGAPFFIQGNYAGTGWNGTADDNQYIDNTGAVSNNAGSDFSIKTQDASKFSVQSVWLYLSNGSLDLTVSGSVTLVGKLAGATVFTAGPVTTGFNTSMSVANGFSYINLVNFGGADNRNKLIDELEVKTGTHYDYVSLDTLTWSKVTDRIFQDTFE